MTKIRVLILLSTIIIVVTGGYFASLYARGYRINPQTLVFEPRGLLVASSDPDGASIYINGELTTATRTTLPLPPATYDIEIRKDGYFTWKKRLIIEKETVTQIGVSLFPSAPSLSAITFSSATNLVANDDLSKIAYAVVPSTDSSTKPGLWAIELTSLPFGFNREPIYVTDGDLSQAKWEWSPTGRELLLTIGNGVFLLDAGKYTSQAERVNIASKQDIIKAEWATKRAERLTAKLSKLPLKLQEIFDSAATEVVFSPTEDKVLYTATSDRSLPAGVLPQLPGASTQKQVRDIKPGKKYVFDIKEDRNFEVGKQGDYIYWLPTSNHLIVPEPNKISLVDYDGTNKITVYTGQYDFPHAYPYSNGSRLLILTNLGSSTTTKNLYTIALK